MQSSLLFLLRVWKSQKQSLLAIPIFFQVAEDCGFLKYFCAYYNPSILIKHFDWGLMSVLVWVHHSMMYCQNKTLKILAINTRNFLSSFCSIFVIFKFSEYTMLNMLFQFLHFRDMRSYDVYYWNKNDWWKHFLIKKFLVAFKTLEIISDSTEQISQHSLFPILWKIYLISHGFIIIIFTLLCLF